MVRAAAVVLNSASELGEHVHHHIVRGVVFVEVVEEVADCAGQVLQKLGMGWVFVGVRVIAAVAGVEDARAKPGGMHPGDVAQALRNGGITVLHIGGVLRGRRLQPVCAAKHIHARAREVLHHGARAYRLGVHIFEYLKGLVALFVFADAGHQAVVVQVVDRGDRHAGNRHSARQSDAEVDACQFVFALGVELSERLAYPAFGYHLVRLAGVPDVHAAEVGAVGVGVADALHNGDLALFEHILDGPEVGVERERVVYRQHILALDLDQFAVIVVGRAVVGDERVHKVVSTRQLHND